MPYKDLKKRRQFHREYSRKWAKDNRERMRASSRRYYWLHREEIKRRKKGQRDKSEQSYQVRARRYHRVRIQVLKMYSGGRPKCACCGETRYEFLTIDHVRGDGAEDRLKMSRGSGFYGKLLKMRINRRKYQVLCYNCNMSKRLLGVCAHRSRSMKTLEDWERWSSLRVVKTPKFLREFWLSRSRLREAKRKRRRKSG
jgi:hypothetical protein